MQRQDLEARFYQEGVFQIDNIDHFALNAFLLISKDDIIRFADFDFFLRTALLPDACKLTNTEKKSLYNQQVSDDGLFFYYASRRQLAKDTFLAEQIKSPLCEIKSVPHNKRKMDVDNVDSLNNSHDMKNRFKQKTQSSLNVEDVAFDPSELSFNLFHTIDTSIVPNGEPLDVKGIADEALAFENFSSLLEENPSPLETNLNDTELSEDPFNKPVSFEEEDNDSYLFDDFSTRLANPLAVANPAGKVSTIGLFSQHQDTLTPPGSKENTFSQNHGFE